MLENEPFYTYLCCAMKKRIKPFLILFVALAIVASSTGITFFKMVCGKSGKEIVSLQAFTNCCKKNTPSCHSINKKCCDFSKQTFKLSLLHKDSSKPFSFISAVTFFVSHTVFYKVHSYSLPIILASDTSPPKSGREILCLHATYLI